MKTRPLGASGIDASVVGLGTWAIGGWMWGGTDAQDSIAAIHAGLDAGITLVDTAPAYGFGASEELVGRAIADRRDRVVLATKCGLVWDREKGELFFESSEQAITAREATGNNPTYRVHRYLGPESIRDELHASLRRLKTDYVDLYQTHWQDKTTPIEDTMAELLKLKDQGLIRAIGVSNVEPDQLRAYAAAGQVDVDQECYSMLDRGVEETLLPICEKQGVAFLAYSSMAQGLLTGKMSPDRTFADGDLRKDNPRFSVENRQRITQMLKQIKPVAEKHGCTFGHLAVAWAVAQPGCTHALVGARNAEQARENAQAGRVELDGDDVDAINAALREHAPAEAQA